METAKFTVILSSKSSGSTAVQNFLIGHTQAKAVKHTRHQENETLYWTKSASLLCLPQIALSNSEIPISQIQAKIELTQFLTSNLRVSNIEVEDRHDVHFYWKKLCEEHSPIFIEKSPHHLAQRSAIKLLHEFTETYSNVDYLIVILTRDPRDVIYSHHKRWRINPRNAEKDWLNAYSNVEYVKLLFKDKVKIIRYEDLAGSDSNTEFNDLVRFCGGEPSNNLAKHFYSSSINRWRQDKSYYFKPRLETTKIAASLGYRLEDEGENYEIGTNDRVVRIIRFFIFRQMTDKTINGLRKLKNDLRKLKFLFS